MFSLLIQFGLLPFLQGSTAGGVIPKDKMERFKDAIQEGGLHRFIQRTIANPVMPRPKKFPKFPCTALPMAELEKRVGTNIIMSAYFI